MANTRGVHLRSDHKTYYKTVTLKERGPNGKHKKYPVYGKSVTEVLEKAAEIERAVEDGTFLNKRDTRKHMLEERKKKEEQALIDQQQTELQKKLEKLGPDNMTLGDWYEYWLEQYKAARLKDYTLSTYRGYLRNYMRIKPDSSKPPTDKVNVIASYHLGDYRLKDLSGLLLQEFYNTCLSVGLKSQSIHKVSGAISECLSKSVLLGIIPQNPALLVELPKGSKAELEVLSKDEMISFLNLMHQGKEPRENVVGIILCLGLRVSEALGLSWDNVDFDNKTITICQQLQRRKRREDSDTVYTLVTSTKNGKSRTIYASDICFKYLNAEKKKQEQWERALGECYDNPYNLCFTNPDGSNISQASITICVKKYAKAVGKPNLRVHDLRHSFATMIAAEPNIPIATASAILGHSTTSFTLNHYVHNRVEDKKNAQGEMTKLFEEIRSPVGVGQKGPPNSLSDNTPK